MAAMKRVVEEAIEFNIEWQGRELADVQKDINAAKQEEFDQLILESVEADRLAMAGAV